MGGRGAGKTRAGAEWVRREVAAGRARRIALVGPTLSDVREVMIEGVSGLRSVGPAAERPVYLPSRRRLVWPNGAVAQAFSASDPDSLRGPQFDLAWCDEIGAWTAGEAAWSNLAFALRLGVHPRVMATTTPRPVPLVRRLVKAAGEGRGVAMTRGATTDNADALAPGFIEALHEQFGRGRLMRQEMLGELVEEVEGAMFTRAVIDGWRTTLRELCGEAAPAVALDRIVVAIDPPAGSKATSNRCGIVVAGRKARTAFVLEDASVQGVAPAEWAARAIAAARRWGAVRIVAEANQGGDMVRSVLDAAGVREAGLTVGLRHASKSKGARAEPVSVRYGEGRVRHAGEFPELEDEMCAFVPGASESPDRMDALVWAVCELLEPQAPPRAFVL